MKSLGFVGRVIIIKSKVMSTIFFFTLLTSGCNNTSAVVDVITFQPSNYDVKFITDHSSEETQNAYIDAILELKAEYPAEFKAIEEEEKNINDIQNTINIEGGPTLIILRNGQTISQLSGNKPKSEIMHELEITISDIE